MACMLEPKSSQPAPLLITSAALFVTRPRGIRARYVFHQLCLYDIGYPVGSLWCFALGMCLKSCKVGQNVKLHIMRTRPSFATMLYGHRISASSVTCISDCARQRGIGLSSHGFLPGTEWRASQLSFSGSFSTSFPGCWVPIPWGPSRVLQMMFASSDPNQVNVLVEHHRGTDAVSFVHTITLRELADELHTMASSMSVVGTARVGPDEPVRLRDGDILHDSLLMTDSQPRYGWPDDDGDAVALTPPIGLAILAARFSKTLALYCILSGLWAPGAAMRSHSSSRSPRPNTHRRRLGDGAPLTGRWRPDSAQPLLDVVVTDSFSYRILCPFQGWSTPTDGDRQTSLSALVSSMRDWCSIWALRPILQGGFADHSDGIGPSGWACPTSYRGCLHFGTYLRALVAAGLHVPRNAVTSPPTCYGGSYTTPDPTCAAQIHPIS